MRKELFNELICPLCKNKKMSLIVYKEKRGEIESGIIKCRSCNKRYAIKYGIPIMIDSEKNYESYENWNLMWKKAKSDKKDIKKNEGKILNYFGSARIIERHNNIEKSLEIGCGSGMYSFVLSELGIVKDIYLMDISLESLKLAKKTSKEKGIRCNLILADAFSIPFTNNFFDISLSGGLIEHFKFSAQKKIVDEHCRVSRRTVIQVPTNTIIYWIMRMFITLRRCGWTFGYEKPISRKLLIKLLDNANFSIKDETYHDILTAFYFLIYPRIGINMKKNFLNLLAKHEIIVYAESSAREK